MDLQEIIKSIADDGNADSAVPAMAEGSIPSTTTTKANSITWRKLFPFIVILSLLLVVVLAIGAYYPRLYHQATLTIKHEFSTPPQIVTVTVAPKDSLSKIFQRLNLNTKDIQKILAYKEGRNVYNIRPGQELSFAIDVHSHDWVNFAYPLTVTDTLVVTKDHQDKVVATVKHTAPVSHLEYVAAAIQGKDFAKAAVNAGLSSALTKQLKTIFQNQVNFSNGIHDGDKFALLYRVESIGKKRMPDKVMAAEFDSNNKVYKAIRYTDQTGQTRYYDEHGLALQPSFMRVPVHYVRISSKFSLHRYHPILHIYCAHLGVDFAGKLSTPVTATADGKIAFMGSDGGYGNVVLIKHDNKYSTLYAHLLKFNQKFHAGSTIKQGQVLGYLGNTGLSTGPHVHYEFRINGVHYDPLKVNLPRITWVAANERNEFLSEAHTLFAELDSHHYIQLAANE